MGFKDDDVLGDLFCILSGYLSESVRRETFGIDKNSLFTLFYTFYCKLQADICLSAACLSKYLCDDPGFKSISQEFV